jgi:tetratricopeptide (TPR) repeat protein
MSKITTFYSYKGGSGRSMAMANVAWALATNGERVLTIDWDLEAPGLHRYFHPFLADPEQASSRGLVDRVWEYIDRLPGPEGSDVGMDRFALADCGELVQELELPSRTARNRGCLHFLGAGRQDDDYSDKVGGLDWSSFYARFDGATFIDKLLAWARGRYSHILIDSRTGVADTAGICTTQAPDALVMCFVYNRQSIEGTAAIARSVVSARRARKQKALEIRVVPSRVEERSAVEAARRYTTTRLGEVLKLTKGSMERVLRRNEIRHYPWCAFEEKLAVFEDAPDERGSLLDVMHELAGHVADRKLKIANFGPDVLSAIWRRAAFDDPRLVDLKALGDGSLDDAVSRLNHWLYQAMETQDERPDWLISLGESAVEFAGMADDRFGLSEADALGHAGFETAFRAFVADRDQYRTRFALVLHARAGQLQKQARYEEALQLATNSVALFSEDRRGVAKWRQARSLDRAAQILEQMDRGQDALAAYRAAAYLYQSIDRRQMPLGAEMDSLRALRVLAEKLLAVGDYKEAVTFAERAVAQLEKRGGVRSGRNEAEVVNILAVSAEASARADRGQAEFEIARTRVDGRAILTTPVARKDLERRISIAEAGLFARRGEIARALAVLEQLPHDLGHTADAIILRAEILLDARQEALAADLLAEAVVDPEVSVSNELLDFLRRALTATGRQAEFAYLVLQRAALGDRDDIAILAPFIQTLAQHGASQGSIDWASSSFSDRQFRARLPGKTD